MVDSTKILLQVSGSQLNADELAELTRNLRAALLSTEVDDVVPQSHGPAPLGAKAIETFALGALVVSMAPTLAGVVVDVVASWLKRQRVDVEVLIDGQQLRGSFTPEQREAIVAAFLLRATDRAGPI
jgi:hypothetical protein